MGLKEDVLAGISEVVGANFAETVIANFDNPKKYPKEFLDEYLFFMQKILGDAAERKAVPLYKKYRIKQPLGTKAISSARAVSVGL